MKACVIENDDCAFGQFRQEYFLEPFVEYGAVAHAGEPERSEQLPHEQRRYNADADGSVAGACGKAARAFRTSPIGIGFVVVDAGFIYPDAQMLRHFRQLLQESRLFFWTRFLVAVGLFFRLQPSFFTARHIAIWLTCSSAIAFQRSAICCKV